MVILFQPFPQFGFSQDVGQDFDLLVDGTSRNSGLPPSSLIGIQGSIVEPLHFTYSRRHVGRQLHPSCSRQ
jgi:hypothetical protein